MILVATGRRTWKKKKSKKKKKSNESRSSRENMKSIDCSKDRVNTKKVKNVVHGNQTNAIELGNSENENKNMT